MIDKNNSKTITFMLGNMIFEYDEWKNEYNLEHHGISFRNAARVFFDYDRIELLMNKTVWKKQLMYFLLSILKEYRRIKMARK